MKIFIIIVLLLGGIILLSFMFDNNNSEPLPDNGGSEEVVADVVTNDTKTQDSYIAIMQTSLGDIKLELFAKDAPKTVENFVKLARSGFYDGTKFHRVIKDFMIQGGDPLSKDDSAKDRWGTGGPGYAFEDEINSNKLVGGILAMANSGPNTNGSQFFIVTAQATPWLDGLHTAFGRVIDGMDVVMAINGVASDAGDKPLENVVVEKIIIE